MVRSPVLKVVEVRAALKLLNLIPFLQGMDTSSRQYSRAGNFVWFLLIMAVKFYNPNVQSC